MKNKIIKGLIAAASAAICLGVGALGALDYTIPNNVSAKSYEQVSAQVCDSVSVGLYYDGEEACAAFAQDINSEQRTATATVFGIPFKRVEVSVFKDIELIPGGDAFGVRLHSKGVIIVGIGGYETENGTTVNPASDAGLRVRDIITSVGGTDVNSSMQLTEAVENSGGKPLEIKYIRDNKLNKTTLTPLYGGEGKYKAGLWVKDSTAGIGTITYYNPKNGTFGGLGHGVCEADTGQLIPFSSGEAYEAIISGTAKGTPGDPGELRGYFSSTGIGYLTDNTEQGVFGKYTGKIPQRQPMPIALKNEVKTGDVTIYCTIDGSKVITAAAKIVKITSYDGSTKNFIIEITDKYLLETTGGIVQGMSGSTICQNGKIIGAVTHVMINDPTRGYGIFIENMLKVESAA